MKHADPNVITRCTLDLQPFEVHDVLNICYGSPRIDGNALGWVPRAAFDGMHEQGRMLACWNNDDLVGYVVWGCTNRQMRIFLTWVRPDARLILHGRALVDHVDTIARRMHAADVRLFCATDLAANMFWAALGFEQISWRYGRGKNGRRHWQWRRHVGINHQVQLASDATPQAELVRPSPPLVLPQAAPANGTARLWLAASP